MTELLGWMEGNRVEGFAGSSFTLMSASGVLAALGFSLLVRAQAVRKDIRSTIWGAAWTTHVLRLDEELRFLRVAMEARVFAGLQLMGAFCGLFLGLLLGPVGLFPWVFVLASHVLLRVEREKRVVRIDSQVEGWLGAMARALEASPSVGDALEASATAIACPLRDEITQTVSEIHLGRPLDRALRATSERIASRTFSLALSTLLVGRQTGGSLPEVLRTSAAALREMDRLHGVLRTKTAEGRNQAMLIAALPFPLYFLIRTMDPGYFLPLEQTPTGHLLVLLAGVLWVASALWARKILAVQL